jgi:hypothetical protein
MLTNLYISELVFKSEARSLMNTIFVCGRLRQIVHYCNYAKILDADVDSQGLHHRRDSRDHYILRSKPGLHREKEDQWSQSEVSEVAVVTALSLQDSTLGLLSPLTLVSIITICLGFPLCRAVPGAPVQKLAQCHGTRK